MFSPRTGDTAHQAYGRPSQVGDLLGRQSGAEVVIFLSILLYDPYIHGAGFDVLLHLVQKGGVDLGAGFADLFLDKVYELLVPSNDSELVVVDAENEIELGGVSSCMLVFSDC